eukprot:3187483-Pleurochrysis_carterae.AAC.1
MRPCARVYEHAHSRTRASSRISSVARKEGRTRGEMGGRLLYERARQSEGRSKAASFVEKQSGEF